MKQKYVILSVERRDPRGYFVAIHGYSPFYSTIDKARLFDTEKAAKDYANAELFTDADASVIMARSVE